MEQQGGNVNKRGKRGAVNVKQKLESEQQNGETLFEDDSGDDAHESSTRQDRTDLVLSCGVDLSNPYKPGD